jgi:hypothetical protein
VGPPGITIVEPTAGAAVAIGSVLVRGVAGSPTTAVSVNGVAALVSGSAWAVEIPTRASTNTLTASALLGSGSVLVDFDTRAVTAFTGDTSDEFVLLRGGLYSVADTRFHTRDTLAETALPLPLAPGPVAEPSLGAYHLIDRE